MSNDIIHILGVKYLTKEECECFKIIPVNALKNYSTNMITEIIDY